METKVFLDTRMIFLSHRECHTRQKCRRDTFKSRKQHKINGIHARIRQPAEIRQQQHIRVVEYESGYLVHKNGAALLKRPYPRNSSRLQPRTNATDIPNYEKHLRYLREAEQSLNFRQPAT